MWWSSTNYGSKNWHICNYHHIIKWGHNISTIYIYTEFNKLMQPYQWIGWTKMICPFLLPLGWGIFQAQVSH